MLWDMVGTEMLWRDIAPPFAFSHPLERDFHLHCQLSVPDGCWCYSHSIRLLSLDGRMAEEQERLLAVSASLPQSVHHLQFLSVLGHHQPLQKGGCLRQLCRFLLSVFANREFTHAQHTTHICSLIHERYQHEYIKHASKWGTWAKHRA